MGEINNGGPAFPADPHWLEPATVDEGKRMAQGMTLRQFFAAHAVSGVLHMVATGQHELGVVRPTGAAGIARSAYEIADAMIKAGSA
jgi:hypothetical protein